MTQMTPRRFLGGGTGQRSADHTAGSLPPQGLACRGEHLLTPDPRAGVRTEASRGGGCGQIRLPVSLRGKSCRRHQT